MNTLRTLKKLLFGETWLLPLGLALIVGVNLVARQVLDDWHRVGGFILLGCVVVLLTASVSWTSKPR